jgi:CHASE3 domain sensor protein
MADFLKSLANILATAATALGLLAIFFKALTPLMSFLILGALLFLGFISVVVYQLNKVEIRLDKLEDKYKRAEELIDIKADILDLKRK